MLDGDAVKEHELRELARTMRLEPGAVLQLVDHEGDRRPWTFLLLDLGFESGRAQLLRLDDCSEGSRRCGTLSLEDLEDLLDDLSSSKAGIHWTRVA